MYTVVIRQKIEAMIQSYLKINFVLTTSMSTVPKIGKLIHKLPVVGLNCRLLPWPA